METRIAGVILAGGRASRMGGGDKALRSIAGRPLLAHVAERLRPQVKDMALNANGDPARFTVFELSVVPDPLPAMGPLGGILAGLHWGQRMNFTHVATVACDTPFFPHDFVDRLRAAQDTAERIVQSRSDNRTHPTFALWPVTLAADLEMFLRRTGPTAMRSYAGERHKPNLVDFPLEGPHDPFFNINTPDDLKTAEKMAETMK